MRVNSTSWDPAADGSAADPASLDSDARRAEAVVGRTANLVLQATVLADRYEQAAVSADPVGQAARVEALREVAEQGRSFIVAVAAGDRRSGPGALGTGPTGTGVSGS